MSRKAKQIINSLFIDTRTSAGQSKAAIKAANDYAQAKAEKPRHARARAKLAKAEREQELLNSHKPILYPKPHTQPAKFKLDRTPKRYKTWGKF